MNHDADPCGRIGESTAFDRAVEVAAHQYACEHPGTLVVIIADHGHMSRDGSLGSRPG
jgi:alkaline phosphatase/streptomycin-6-phosphatase